MTLPALPRIIGHRGAAARAPENTLAGLRAAARIGVQCVEFDVRLTADQGLVLFHDDTLERTTGARGRVLDRTAAEVTALDAGVWFGPEFAGETVPSLLQAIALLAELDLAVNIEIKTAKAQARASAQAVADTLGAHWPPAMAPPVVSSFEPAALAMLKDVAPSWPRGYLTRKIGRGWRKRAAALDCRVVSCGDRDLAEGHVGEVKAAGFPLAVYTVNEPRRARQLFDWGADAVFTDVPDTLIAAMGGP